MPNLTAARAAIAQMRDASVHDLTDEELASIITAGRDDVVSVAVMQPGDWSFDGCSNWAGDNRHYMVIGGEYHEGQIIGGDRFAMSPRTGERL